MQEYIKNLGIREYATLIISNDEMNDIIKVVKSLEDSGLFLEGATETVEKMK